MNLSTVEIGKSAIIKYKSINGKFRFDQLATASSSTPPEPVFIAFKTIA